MINTNFLKEIGILLRTYGKASNPLFSLDDGVTITNSHDIANTFNNFFESTKKNIKYPHKHFSNIFQMKLVVQYFWNLLIKKK